ncbi:MAG: S8 family serine peptidase [Planctomycetales bacterium]|nr:S8 family serine peptidase [Planctomycetales bacterium]
MRRAFLCSGINSTLQRGVFEFCASAFVAFALIAETSFSAPAFDLNDPQQRQAFADTLREQRRPGIDRAEEYLYLTGKPKRWQDGQTVCELMSIEDNGQFIVYTTTNANSAISIAADTVRNDPYYGMAGNGITAGIWDAGVARLTHQELAGRVISKDGAAVHWHSTMVAGTLAATGIDPNATGMAPLVNVDGYEWNSDTIEMAAAAMSSPGQVGKIQISNHSYGNICGWHYQSGRWEWYGNPAYRESDLFGQYNYLARDFDQLCYNAPYFLPFRGAGNDRADTARPVQGTAYFIDGDTSAIFDADISPYADNWDNGGFDTLMPGVCAKNVMTVGAVNDAVTGGVRDLGKATMSTLSAWGPADDGRVKPDVVTNGISIYSCYHTSNTAYYTASGTSLASPAAAGAGVQILALYGQLFPGQYMRSSTLKALMIHTADDLGNPGPDYKFGWGLINNEKSAEKLLLHKRNPAANNIIVDSLTRNTNKMDDFTFAWDGISPIRATLCYTDPPGDQTSTGVLDSSAIKLKNDLDIAVTAPDGTTKYYEYVLDPVNPNNPATTGDNARDNVKQVFIQTPEQQGIYTIRVDYDNISASYPVQYYSLIISGQAQPAVYDIDGNGEIGLGDLVSLAQSWLTDTAVCDIYPAAGDGWVDLLDFSLLARKWLEP